MKRTILSIVVMIIAAWIGLFVGAQINGAETTALLFAMIAGFACTICAIESNKKNK